MFGEIICRLFPPDALANKRLLSHHTLTFPFDISDRKVALCHDWRRQHDC